VEFGEGRRGRAGEGEPLIAVEGGSTAEPTEPGRIDLRDAQSVEPLGLVEIAARAEYHRRRGQAVRVLAPRDPNVADYLARMRLGWALSELGAEHNLPYVRAGDRAGQLLELTYFEGTARSDELAALVYHRVAADSPASARALYTSLSEVGQNVPEHAEVPGGWAAARVTRRPAQVWFAVGDCGIGMRRSLAARGARTDAEALEMAMDLGFSRFEAAGHGNGLTETCRLVTARHGRVYMVSGPAGRLVTPRSRRSSDPPAAFPGTLLQGSLPSRG
jgi:hypothetical protein